VIIVGKLDVDGFHRVLIVTAALLILGGLVSFVGIRNPRKVAQPSGEQPAA
ncbi:MAG TPA: MFS transporter, partial [Rhodoglobus sp.]|nr:MFS transporter [Rhodoglobus sp.]